MQTPTNINPAIIDTLYGEALDLAAEAQTLFSIAQHVDSTAADPSLAQLALSSEALRTRTHLMYALAWLMNQRAFLSGTLSAKQLQRQGLLPPAQVDEDPRHLTLLPPQLRDIIQITQRFYRRLERLEKMWTRKAAPAVSVHSQQHRLGLALASGGC